MSHDILCVCVLNYDYEISLPVIVSHCATIERARPFVRKFCVISRFLCCFPTNGISCHQLLSETLFEMPWPKLSRHPRAHKMSMSPLLEVKKYYDLTFSCMLSLPPLFLSHLCHFGDVFCQVKDFSGLSWDF